MLVVVVVGDRHPDVVEHRRRPQQLALVAAGREQAALHERVEHLQRQAGDVLDMIEVGLVLDGQVLDRRPAHVVKQRLGLVGEQRAGEEHPLAQAGLKRLLDTPVLA